MTRWLWRLLVPGEMGIVLFWFVCLVIDLVLLRRVGIVVDVVLLIPNLYSWDYQRRHST